MNPRGGESPQFEAPAFNFEQGADQEPVSEALAAKPESTASRQPAAQVVTDVVIPDAPAIVTPSHDDQAIADSSSTTTSSSIDDKKRIEKEWIDKTKSIASQTRDDPFQQKNQMSRLKADYIQKTFNKKIKVDDAVV